MTSNPKIDPSLPPVSVIILTYNGAAFIAQLLQSLADQTYPKDRLEVIVVDNASTDDTVSIVRRARGAVKLVALGKNFGFAAGNNRGFLNARHDLMVFLNQDTICHPTMLETLVNVMLDDHTLAACNPNIMTPNPSDVDAIDMQASPGSLYLIDLSPYGYGKYRTFTGQPLRYHKLLSGCAFIIRRQTVSKLGYLFDERLWMYAEDTDLSLRIFSLGQRICASRDAVIYHLHPTNAAVDKRRLRLAAQAIRNRVHAFFKNMNGLEFVIFLPFLLLGGNFKVLEFSLPTAKKIIYFVPFSLFSMTCMFLALWQLPRFVIAKGFRPGRRPRSDLSLLKRILCNKS